MTTDDIPIRRGNTEEVAVYCVDEQGVPFDLTGAVIRFQCGRANPPTPLLKSSADPDSGLTLDAEAGIVSLALTAEETRSLRPGRVHPYEFEYVGNGQERTFAAGFLSVKEGQNVDG